MIRYKQGNIINADAEALVNSVNCVGIMGRGIALQFKEAFPSNYKAYVTACKHGDVQPGQMFIYDSGELTWPRYIINFPTKRHWKGKSKIEDIKKGLSALVDDIQRLNIQTIAIPPLGSGLGGLDWKQVKKLIEEEMAKVPQVEVIIYEPIANFTDKATNTSRIAPKMTPGRAALVVLINKYLNGLMDPFISLLEIHKLMYFLQESGEQLRLRYVKAQYGPYAENLRHVLTALEGHLIMSDIGRYESPATHVSLIPGAIDEAENYLKKNTASSQRFDRVANLIKGFETPFGLELLSSVHWIIVKESVDRDKDIIDKMYSWGESKRQFKMSQIELARSRLIQCKWI